jgi:hypothetical protein
MVIQNIWPLLVASTRTISASNVHSIDYLDVFFQLRFVNTQWKWLVETSTEWVAVQLARFHSKGLVMRGTTHARRHALEEYTSALSLLTKPRKLTVAMWHHPLIAPFPDICDRTLVGRA